MIGEPERQHVGGERHEQHQRQAEREEAPGEDAATVAGHELGAGDAVGLVLLHIDHAIEQVDEEPVERAHGGDRPRAVAGEQPAEGEAAQRRDGHDVQPADADCGGDDSLTPRVHSNDALVP